MRDSGGALPLVLLLILALTALGHAAFLVALSEEAASRASVAVVQSRLLAEGGVRRVLRGASGDTLPDPGAGTALLVAVEHQGRAYRVELTHVAPELYLVAGVGSAPVASGARRVEDRAARLVWAMAPVERLRALAAAVEHGAGLEAPPGALEADGMAVAGDLPAPAGCADLGAALDSVLAGRAVEAERLTTFATAGPLPELGLLAHDTLLARLSARVQGTVSPAPAQQDGGCNLDAPANWGSPSAPSGPCGGHRPALASEEGLTLMGGEGQGLLLVAGDLRLTEGTRYAGLVLVGGDLILEGGSELEGMVRVRGRVRVSGGSRIAARLCPALLALRAAHGLRRPLLPPDGGWLRPL